MKYNVLNLMLLAGLVLFAAGAAGAATERDLIAVLQSNAGVVEHPHADGVRVGVLEPQGDENDQEAAGKNEVVDLLGGDEIDGADGRPCNLDDPLRPAQPGPGREELHPFLRQLAPRGLVAVVRTEVSAFLVHGVLAARRQGARDFGPEDRLGGMFGMILVDLVDVVVEPAHLHHFVDARVRSRVARVRHGAAAIQILDGSNHRPRDAVAAVVEAVPHGALGAPRNALTVHQRSDQAHVALHLGLTLHEGLSGIQFAIRHCENIRSIGCHGQFGSGMSAFRHGYLPVLDHSVPLPGLRPCYI